MSGRKRKAPEEPSSPRSSTRPQPANPTAQPTIGSLDCWPCTVSVHELAPDMLPAVFPGLSLGQQHLDLWTALTAHYGTEMDAVYDFWTRARGITMDDLREWKHGPEISSLPRLKVSGAQVATRMIKRLRSLEEEAKAQRIGGLKRALLLMELDYSMLMYGTKRSVLDVMIPDHKERLAYIRQSLGEESPKAKEIVVNVHVTGVGSQSLPEGSPKAKETVPNVQVTEVGSAGGQDTDWEQMVIGFKQELDPNEIPPLAGHRKVIETLEDLMEIPQLFPHLIKSRSNVGFQGILLFGPPGTGKTLLAQTLAARKGLTFYNVPADQLTSKWVGDTEKIMQVLFTVAKANTPTVLFFDEVDYLTRIQTGDESNFDRRAKNQLLELFSKLSKDTSVLLMGATNRPWDIDSAFLSRFQQRLFLDLPDDDEKLQMVVRGLEEDRLVLGEGDNEALTLLLGQLTCSGRDIEAALGTLRYTMLRRLKRCSVFAPVGDSGLWEPCLPSHPMAKRQPFKEWPVQELLPSPITYADLKAALTQVKPSTTDGELERHKKWAAERGVSTGVFDGSSMAMGE